MVGHNDIGPNPLKVNVSAWFGSHLPVPRCSLGKTTFGFLNLGLLYDKWCFFCVNFVKLLNFGKNAL